MPSASAEALVLRHEELEGVSGAVGAELVVRDGALNMRRVFPYTTQWPDRPVPR